jgi:hypothetical protein
VVRGPLDPTALPHVLAIDHPAVRRLERPRDVWVPLGRLWGLGWRTSSADRTADGVEVTSRVPGRQLATVLADTTHHLALVRYALPVTGRPTCWVEGLLPAEALTERTVAQEEARQQLRGRLAADQQRLMRDLDRRRPAD